jgi:hypothetical protein
MRKVGNYREKKFIILHIRMEPITSVMASVPMHTHIVQSLLCYYREFYIGALSLKSPSVCLGVCSFSVQEGKNLIQCGY